MAQFPQEFCTQEKGGGGAFCHHRTGEGDVLKGRRNNRPNDGTTRQSCQQEDQLMLPMGQQGGLTTQQREEGFGWLNGLISHCCHLDGMFEGWWADGGGSDTIINVGGAIIKM